MIVECPCCGSKLSMEDVDSALLEELEETKQKCDEYTALLSEAAITIVKQTEKLALTLTLRQQAIFKMVVAGKSNDDIANALSISSRTVGVHLRTIFRKLGVRTERSKGEFPNCAT